MNMGDIIHMRLLMHVQWHACPGFGCMLCALDTVMLLSAMTTSSARVLWRFVLSAVPCNLFVSL